jgi:hypothetical protein
MSTPTETNEAFAHAARRCGDRWITSIAEDFSHAIVLVTHARAAIRHRRTGGVPMSPPHSHH